MILPVHEDLGRIAPISSETRGIYGQRYFNVLGGGILKADTTAVISTRFILDSFG